MAAIVLLGAFSASGAAAADKYEQLDQQLQQKTQECKAPLTRATQKVNQANGKVKRTSKSARLANNKVKKAKKKAKKARARHSAKLTRKAKKQLRKAKQRARKAQRNLRKARTQLRQAKSPIAKLKQQSAACVQEAEKAYNEALSHLAPRRTEKAPYEGRGSVGDAYVTGAQEGQTLMLINDDEQVVATGTADSYGSKIFYEVPPGDGYSVRTVVDDKTVLGTDKFEVLDVDENPPQSFYDGKTLHEGLNYVTMRDGIELAMTVRLPPGKTLADGPFPTVIEHSGYGTAGPHDLLQAVLTGGDPLAPDTSTAVGALIAPQAGFASVSVQMRGTGCSGGAYGLFDLPTTYDGYDMVETVANQSWSTGKVGLVGISYSGISQLFAGGTRPPHLAAIAPMSVTTDIYTGTGYPGGIFNQGFALSWVTDRVNDAKPTPDGGQQWARVMSTTGDPDITDPTLREEQKQHCLDNQNLRLQTRDVFQMIEDNPYRTPGVFENRSPGKWLAKVDVPVFLVGSFQDEQTGGQFGNALAGLKDNPNVWYMLQNGVHVDSLGPSVITDWADFINLFVADKLPEMPGLLTSLSPMLYGQLADAPALPVQESKYCPVSSGIPGCTYTSVAQAKADFKANTPRLRLLMDNGAATVQGPSDPNPGAPALGGIGANWEIDLPDWPVPNTQAVNYYLGDSGELEQTAPSGTDEESYTADPSARPKQTLPGSGDADAWKAQPPYNWQPLPAGKGLGFTTDALSEDTLIAGPSSLDLQLKSTAPDTDIQVAITEVRPDGNETYVQSGWLRASHRKLDTAKSTALMPVPTHLEADGADLPAGQFSEVRVPIFPVAHMFRSMTAPRSTRSRSVGPPRRSWFCP
ncbi:MAG: CocE/NonD family hydrolase [Solirubrobacterales bacterium]|nr:CocE/NonD family hydrolase [Solirubrobacterales bacterium]